MTYALDAHDGRLLWKTKIEGLLHISNSAALYDGRLFVPIAGTETFAGSNPDYECCRSRGGVAAFDANTGKILWKVHSITEPLKKLGENARGKVRWGPAGASVWNTPTIDAKRKRIYIGTGNNYGPIAAHTSDSILALNMKVEPWFGVTRSSRATPLWSVAVIPIPQAVIAPRSWGRIGILVDPP
jgi:polyvinyl alcohol dehydrogenase (cytochrome)